VRAKIRDSVCTMTDTGMSSSSLDEGAGEEAVDGMHLIPVRSPVTLRSTLTRGLPSTATYMGETHCDPGSPLLAPASKVLYPPVNRSGTVSAVKARSKRFLVPCRVEDFWVLPLELVLLCGVAGEVTGLKGTGECSEDNDEDKGISTVDRTGIDATTRSVSSSSQSRATPHVEDEDEDEGEGEGEEDDEGL
jgi:hypothetical protein